MSKAKHTFFCADLDNGVLSEDESFHATRVMRMGEDDLINIINGKGRSVLAKITSSGKREVGYEIINELAKESHPLNLQIAIAPTKSMDRFSFFLEKTTEMGIREISPIMSQNSERNILKTEKLKKSMISAIKQSGNLFLPILNEAVRFKEFVSRDFGDTQKLIAHCDQNDTKKLLKEYVRESKDILILIGPEGDFTSEEVIFAQENGFSSVSLGEARFRTETAGILACHTVYLHS